MNIFEKDSAFFDGADYRAFETEDICGGGLSK